MITELLLLREKLLGGSRAAIKAISTGWEGGGVGTEERFVREEKFIEAAGGAAVTRARSRGDIQGRKYCYLFCHVAMFEGERWPAQWYKVALFALASS